MRGFESLILCQKSRYPTGYLLFYLWRGTRTHQKAICRWHIAATSSKTGGYHTIFRWQIGNRIPHPLPFDSLRILRNPGVSFFIHRCHAAPVQAGVCFRKGLLRRSRGGDLYSDRRRADAGKIGPHQSQIWIGCIISRFAPLYNGTLFHQFVSQLQNVRSDFLPFFF